MNPDNIHDGFAFRAKHDANLISYTSPEGRIDLSNYKCVQKYVEPPKYSVM